MAPARHGPTAAGFLSQTARSASLAERRSVARETAALASHPSSLARPQWMEPDQFGPSLAALPWALAAAVARLARSRSATAGLSAQATQSRSLRTEHSRATAQFPAPSLIVALWRPV